MGDVFNSLTIDRSSMSVTVPSIVYDMSRVFPSNMFEDTYEVELGRLPVIGSGERTSRFMCRADKNMARELLTIKPDRRDL